MKAVKKAVTFVAVLLFAATMAWAGQQKPAAKPAAKAKRPVVHSAVGEIVSVSDTSLVLSHGLGKAKKETTFTLTSETTKKGEPAAGERARVSYRVEGKEMVATHVAVLPKAKPKPKAKAKPAAK
jgi:hypothetical protein